MLSLTLKSNAISMQRLVLVDQKVRTDKTYPAAFMDVVSIPKTNENFRLLYDTKGRFRLHSIRDEEAKALSFTRFARYNLGKRVSHTSTLMMSALFVTRT